jgi:hypothetical protein
MNIIANTPATRQPIRTSGHSEEYIDVSRVARDYGIHANVQVCSRVLQEYDGYGWPGTSMTVVECLSSLLSYTLHCAPSAVSLPVILNRCADNRPVQVTLHIVRWHSDEHDQVRLDFADETEI